MGKDTCLRAVNPTAHCVKPLTSLIAGGGAACWRMSYALGSACSGSNFETCLFDDITSFFPWVSLTFFSLSLHSHPVTSPQTALPSSVVLVCPHSLLIFSSVHGQDSSCPHHALLSSQISCFGNFHHTDNADAKILGNQIIWFLHPDWFLRLTKEHLVTLLMGFGIPPMTSLLSTGPLSFSPSWFHCWTHFLSLLNNVQRNNPCFGIAA